MSNENRSEADEQSCRRLEDAYHSEKPRFMARLRIYGKTLEEAEDIVQDLYVETMERLFLLRSIRNLPAWLNSLFGRRVIDLWRKDRTKSAAGETDVAEETLREIIAGTGLDPLDAFVRENMVDALNDALRALPKEQRTVVEAQVFGGMTFKEIAEKTGERIDTLTARKRYALRRLSLALRHWIND